MAVLPSNMTSQDGGVT